jgi:hypothetical protein
VINCQVRAFFAPLVVILAVGLSKPLSAQVIGYEPAKSPYRDVDTPNAFSIFGGYLHAAQDPAGVAPESAPVVGLREQIHIGGPAMVIIRLTHSFSDRIEINPTLPASNRVVGTVPAGLTFLDANMGFNVFGERAWHNLQPEVNIGVGLVSDLGTPPDVGGYQFGTKFDVTFGGGVRWIPPGTKFSFHLNADAYIYQLKYPASYHTVAIDGSQVIPSNKPLNDYRTNGMFVFGISYALFR